MEDLSTLIVDFQNYANSLQSGYLKTWKASIMIRTLTDSRLAIVSDNARLFSYLTYCLEMEGFRKADIEKIQRWSIENIG